MNVDELLAIVKQEAARREGRAVAPAPRAAVHMGSIVPPLGPKYLTSVQRRHVRDFLPLFGEEFIHASFQSILWRNADDEARDVYLNAILSRGFSKWEVLARLRYSVEGRKKNVPISGLWPALTLSLAYRVPAIGPLFGTIVALLAMPAYMRDHRVQDARAFAMLRAMGR